MTQVKWVNESNLRATPFGDTVCGKEVQVLPLAALQEVVKGLRKIAGYHWQADSIKEAQRLLALLGEVR